MAAQTRTHTVNCENTFAALLVETSSTLIAAPVARPAAANASVRRFPRRRPARPCGRGFPRAIPAPCPSSPRGTWPKTARPAAALLI